MLPAAGLSCASSPWPLSEIQFAHAQTDESIRISGVTTERMLRVRRGEVTRGQVNEGGKKRLAQDSPAGPQGGNR